MTVIIYLLAVSLFLGASGLLIFLWALKHGQFEDLDGAANRILFDDEPLPKHDENS
ncbi:cbb3-type cytochrome oxidase assembly protein CcoS [Methyloferula stellata]|uniref:cbb3-type cytochrome oxidase assembly protein CcoS n=1 Tax=Methyloferula stellata TaxID=876270 RepID=UPI000364E523|nr:cbb3-type cytochrome oxidase assembly protein CcoS [Methyloferula stellata]